MRRTVLAVALAAMVALAGCSALDGVGGAGEPGTDVPGEGVTLGDDDPGATDVEHSLRMRVDETAAGEEWTEIGATYLRDRFAVGAAQRDEIALGVDTDGDGELDRGFNVSQVRGVDNSEFSFDVTLDTGYTLQEGDVVFVSYPAIDSPAEPGEYEVEIRLNGQHSESMAVTIE